MYIQLAIIQQEISYVYAQYTYVRVYNVNMLAFAIILL